MALSANSRRCSDMAAVGGTPDSQWTGRYRRLYGLFIVKRFQSGDLSFLLSFIGFFVRSGIPFLRPDPQYCKSRRAQELSRLAVAPTFPRPLPLARPYLDSSEHGGTLDAVGMTIRGEPAFGRANQSRHILVCGGSKGSEP